MRSLVTGGAGFIGSHVARHCLELGHEVVVLDDLSGGFEQNVPRAARLIEGSVTDHALVERVFAESKFDFVYHLAAYAAEGLSHFIRRFNYTNNLVGSANLINAAVAHSVRCLVFTSSIAVYGAAQTPMEEDQTPLPEDPYGISKYAVELDLRSAHAMFGLDFIVFRPHNVYGEHQNIGDRYRNVIGIFMNQVMRGEPMTIFGDGTQTRAFSHIHDVAPLIARSVDIPEARNDVFNVGADQPYTVRAVAEAVARVFGVEPRIEFLPARLEVEHAFSQHDKAQRVFGRHSCIGLEDGIERMARWARSHGARETQPFTRIELDRNLPPSWAQWTRAKS
ncbi:MAG TPA: NAD-dependent epimerase/dehydratase family protein [Candidatus Binataceae bacterium]|nr:NAD-dependent epimerase/dehydratase family protein [Candidatus Binataceae bacterium]